jgi:hypothetical protein
MCLRSVMTSTPRRARRPNVGISAQGYGNMLAMQTVGDQIGSAMQQQAERCPSSRARGVTLLRRLESVDLAVSFRGTVSASDVAHE